MKIAVEGCGHGKLDDIYRRIQHIEDTEQLKIDLLIICGDFQATRNAFDLSCMAVPSKYRNMEDFHDYYRGHKKAYVPTLFIGGNHEAANHLWELYYGGWVCPDIYFLGYSGVIWFGGLRIGGISGIYDPRDYHCNYFERLPYCPGDLRSIYHTRKYEVDKLLQIKAPLDIFLSHDWPQGIYHHGPTDELLQRKPYFGDEIRRNELGSPPLRKLLQTLKPGLWFSAHLHVKFAAIVDHRLLPGESCSPHDIEANSQLFRAKVASMPLLAVPGSLTRFLALDKCLPRRDYLQIIDVPERIERPYEPGFHYDREWLEILRCMAPHFPLAARRERQPGNSISKLEQIPSSRLSEDLLLKIPHNFAISTAIYPFHPNDIGQPNPQTVQFCDMIGVPDATRSQFDAPAALHTNPEEIDLA